MLRIRNDFKDLIPPLTGEEFDQLEQNILADGIRDPLVLWGDILVDGHNRYEIAQRHGLDFDTVQMEFADADDVKRWIILNQFGRRNLPAYERARLALQLKPILAGEARKRQGVRNDLADIVQNSAPSKTRDELAKIAGVSHDTIVRVEKIEAKASPELKAATRNNELSVNMAYEVTKMDTERQEEVAERIRQGESPKEVVADVKKRPHISYNSGNNEWYTPKEFIDAARMAMGSIDLDPASNDIANEVVQAETYYTIETNGLDKDWCGNVWLNPPYASDLIDKFVDKLVEQVEIGNVSQAVVLVNNATETGWFSKLVHIANALCFPKSRVKFYMPDGKTGAPLQGQAVLYIGNKPRNFVEAFRDLGWGCYPEWSTMMGIAAASSIGTGQGR